MTSVSAALLGQGPLPAPQPNARVLGGAGVAWGGGEGESVADPVTPGVLWLGGTKGGARCEGLTHRQAGPPNGGDVAVAPHNLRLRAVTLEAVERSFERAHLDFARPFRREAHPDAPLNAPPREPAYKLDPDWKHPLEEAGGDASRMRNLTLTDVVQSMLRSGKEGVYCSPPEKWGQRQLVMDLLTCPWVFPWHSRLFPNCASARKFYALALAKDFQLRLPGLGERTLSRSQFFELVFRDLLPSFPDLSFNAQFLTTTGLDDCCHVDIQVTGTHTGAPFAPFGWTPLVATGKRVALPSEFLRLRIANMAVQGVAADPLPPDQEHLGFPTGIYVTLGGQLPGF